MSSQYYEGIGRRKRSSARVRLISGGTGNIVVNGKPVGDYFPRLGDVEMLQEPLRHANLETDFDVSVKVMGGGVTGQRDAVKMGLARAIVKFDEELRSAMRKGGFLTRDAREKERKKPGLKRARKAPTYTKR
jgi:small subunit ribosomal protein S9